MSSGSSPAPAGTSAWKIWPRKPRLDHAKLESRLDEEYHKKVPPFKPAPYAGRKNPKANQVVLMELFTGDAMPALRRRRRRLRRPAS